ncbi:MAG: DUF1194 domain-containing protein [Rhodobacteraceae bacterium]|jgi:Ca-activated chloride channel family protein|nr:DUF1194 domain-containing protein [Paracoccaceae bacterium]
MRRAAAALGLCALLAAPTARACDVALLLAMDVSGSVDRGEYRMQTGGLAAALGDPQVVAALIAGQAAIAVAQWSGVGQQALSIPWQRLLEPVDVARLAAQVAAMPRAFDRSDTAVGDAIRHGAAQFTQAADCDRRVIDISGDGSANAGLPAEPQSRRAQAAGITINAIAIEDMGRGISVTEFYRRLVITRGGFVVTARGHLDYTRAIQAKLLREVVSPSG